MKISNEKRDVAITEDGNYFKFKVEVTEKDLRNTQRKYRLKNRMKITIAGIKEVISEYNRVKGNRKSPSNYNIVVDRAQHFKAVKAENYDYIKNSCVRFGNLKEVQNDILNLSIESFSTGLEN